MTVPKIIWFLWLQGLGAAPPLVKDCLRSWIELNPDYRVIFLSEKNLSEHLNSTVQIICKNNNLTPQVKSDIIRINLLADHGGIWADSSCACQTPLNIWLADKVQNGFFVFTYRNHKHLLASWFIVSKKEHYLTRTLADFFNKFWMKNSDLMAYQSANNLLNTLLLKTANRILRKNNTWWFKTVVIRNLRVYPYFIFHYAFEYLLSEDKKFAESYNKIPYVSAKKMSVKYVETTHKPYVIKYSHH